MKDWQDIEEALAYLELRSIDEKGFLFCHTLEIARELFPGEIFRQGDFGWFTEVERRRIILMQESLFSGSGKAFAVKDGGTLLHDEERTLFLWQNDGSLVVASEDGEWSQLLARQSYAEPLLAIKRPGSRTKIWRLPEERITLR